MLRKKKENNVIRLPSRSSNISPEASIREIVTPRRQPRKPTADARQADNK
jgi:hypothetical protein